MFQSDQAPWHFLRNELSPVDFLSKTVEVFFGLGAKLTHIV